MPYTVDGQTGRSHDGPGLGTGVTSIRRETLGGQLFELLRHRILTGELSGGRRLVQGELAGELRVSRIPVRDALRRLEAEGLVEGDDVGRYSVIPFTRDDAAEVYAIRRRLEPLAAALAARKATNEELDEIRALFEAMDSVVREAGPKLDVDHSVRFHMAIYEASPPLGPHDQDVVVRRPAADPDQPRRPDAELPLRAPDARRAAPRA